VRLPMAARGVIAEPYPAGTAPIAAQQVGGHAGFVNEDVAARVVEGQGGLPLPARRGDVRPAQFVGVNRFFLR
jgi:hypothetical protein